MVVSGDVIQKSQITVPPPDYPIRFSLLGKGKMVQFEQHNKMSQYDVFYEMYRQHPVVRGAIEKISKYAVSTGFHFEAEDKNEDVPKNKSRVLNTFFRNSNALHLLRLTYKDLQIYGEAFWIIERTLLGTPTRALRAHPKYMYAQLGDDDQLIGWQYGPNLDDKPKKYKINQVLQVKIDDPDNDTGGLSPLHSLQLTVATDLNAMHFNGNFFENSAQTGLIIILKTSSGDEAIRNRQWLDDNYVGTRNAHRPLLLEGDVDVKPSVNRMTDMQYVEGRILSRQEIMIGLDIPPEKLNIVEDFRRQTPGAGDNFQSETIAPLQAMLEEEINNFLILGIFGWDDIVFRHNAASQQNQLDQAKLFHEYMNMGVLSPDQVADRLGWPKIKGGDQHYFQTAAGLVPVEMAQAVAQRLISGDPLPDPISGVGTDTTGSRNPPKATGAEKTRLND